MAVSLFPSLFPLSVRGPSSKAGVAALALALVALPASAEDARPERTAPPQKPPAIADVSRLEDDLSDVSTAVRPSEERGVASRLVLSRTLSPRLRSTLLEIFSAEALTGAEVSFFARSLKTGEVIAELDADRLINPASNAKLITTAAALDVLKPEYRFKTEYYIRGRLKDGTLWGDLIIKGYGDPTVVSERLQRVASELSLYGIERITGSVIVDDSWFDDILEAKGWAEEENPDRAYAAPVSALSLNFNAVAIYIRPAERGQPAVVKVDPPVEYVTLQGTVDTRRTSRRLRVVSQADRTSTLVQVSGAVGDREQPFRVYRRIYDPPRYFASALIAFLKQRGVKVHHRIQKGTVPPGARLILVDRSPQLTEIVSDLNHYSNNFIAETLIKAMAAEASGGERPGSFDEGLKIARRFMQEKLGLSEDAYVFGNGSGLNDVNRLSARQVVELLAFMSQDFETGWEFVSSLAVAGTRGTLGFRMRETAAERRLRAKTGTLKGVSALSGYVVDPTGDVIAFSFLTQGYKGSVSKVWDVQNQLGEALASGGEAFVPEEEDVVAAGEPSLKAPAEPAKGGAP